MKNNGIYPNRKSIRLQNRSYTSGTYYVTICTKDRELFFGNIVGSKMQLNEMGMIAKRLWNEIPEKFEDVCLHDFDRVISSIGVLV